MARLRWKEFTATSKLLYGLESAIVNHHEPGVLWSFDKDCNKIVTNAPMALIRRMAYLAGAANCLPRHFLALTKADEFVQAVIQAQTAREDGMSEYEAGHRTICRWRGTARQM